MRKKGVIRCARTWEACVLSCRGGWGWRHVTGRRGAAHAPSYSTWRITCCPLLKTFPLYSSLGLSLIACILNPQAYCLMYLWFLVIHYFILHLYLSLFLFILIIIIIIFIFVFVFVFLLLQRSVLPNLDL